VDKEEKKKALYITVRGSHRRSYSYNTVPLFPLKKKTPFLGKRKGVGQKTLRKSGVRGQTVKWGKPRIIRGEQQGERVCWTF